METIFKFSASTISLVFFFLLCLAFYHRYQKVFSNYLYSSKSGNAKAFLLNRWAKKHKRIIMFVLLVLFFFTRLFMITEVPRGIHVDEAGMAYDAFCLAESGVDRYLYPFPVVFNGYFGAQSALYTYLTAGLMKFFSNHNFNLLLIRTPAVLGGFLTFLSVYHIAKKVSKEILFAFLSAFLVVISPYFIMASRWGLDCNLFLGFYSMGVWMILEALETRHLSKYLLSALFLGISLYTYAIAWLIIPVFCLVVIGYLCLFSKIQWRNVIPAAVLLFLIALPLILFFAVNQGWIDEIMLEGLSINRLFNFRVSEISLRNIPENLNNIKSLLTHDFLPYNSLQDFGTLYLFAIPFTLYGIVKITCITIDSIKKRRVDYTVILFISFISVLLCVLLILGMNINKANGIFMPLILCTAIGINDCIQTWKKSATLIGITYFISFILFFRYYLFVYPKEIYPQYLFDDTSYSTLIELKDGWDIENHVIYTNINQERCGYIFILMANQILPQEMDSLISSWYSHIGNFIFEIPEEINKDAIYLLNINQQNIEFENKLIHAGFQWQVNEVGTYRIYFFESQKH